MKICYSPRYCNGGLAQYIHWNYDFLGRMSIKDDTRVRRPAYNFMTITFGGKDDGRVEYIAKIKI